MTEETPQIQAAYSVVIKADGALETIPVTEGVGRIASTYDIYHTSKQLVSEIDDFLLAERVAKAVVDALQPVLLVSSSVQRLLKHYLSVG